MTLVFFENSTFLLSGRVMGTHDLDEAVPKKDIGWLLTSLVETLSVFQFVNFAS